MEDIFTDEFLKEIEFKRVEHDHSPPPLYGKAHSIKDNGMTQLTWCLDGHSVTYFGEPLEPNISFAIKKDGGTRYAFSGYVRTQEDVKKLLSLTW